MDALTHDDYTVGWVCALPKEQVAAIAMLDQRHGDLPRRANDHNTYNLGSIGDHNIVIACLPKGRIGTTSAAVVAKDMVETFPSIRISFLVGIGGGIPAKVRLGDVVVGVPEGNHPGVIQWDLGKAVDGGAFERTGSLDKPPASLLTAISKLEAEHELGESRIPGYLKEIETKFPKLVDKYLRSARLVDVPFKARYSHVKKPQEEEDEEDEDEDEDEEEEEDETCKYCDKTQTIKRKDRDMKIHYGLIASGNQVIKDAARRDDLNKMLGGKVLCIEMEAAGLLDHFPCLVIRGICDYADSHKNKAWQEHAAAVAAAFAKELLHSIPPSEVQMERPVRDVLSELSQELSAVGKEIVNLKLRADKSQDQEMLDWLTKHDYGFQYSDFLKRRQPGTGQWLLDSTPYQRWRQTPNQTLFCPGIPGAGKTILASIVIEDLYRRSSVSTGETTGIAYIFCNFRRGDEQRLEDLAASLVKQLAEGLSPLPGSLKTLYEDHVRMRTRPTFDELLQVLHSTAALYSRVFFIIDALDECQISQDGRNKLLHAVFGIQERVGANLCVTSRHIPEIKKLFADCTTLEIRADAKDVQRYLRDRISELTLAEFVRKRPTLEEKVCSEITRAADGMFLLAQLHLDSLKGVLSENGLLKALRNLAKGSDAYGSAYGSAMDRIKHQIKPVARLAEQVLAWITYARRPLTVDELRTALSIQKGSLTFDDGDLIQVDMVSICAGLVTIDQGSSVIRLIHYTVQEYFEETREEWFPHAQQKITIACVTYLSFEDFSTGTCPNDKEFEQRLRKYPFYHYAAENWGHHASTTDGRYLVRTLLDKQAQVEASSQALLVSRDSFPRWSQNFPRRMHGLHLAARFGLEAVIQEQRHNARWDLDVRDSRGGTALSWATEYGHEDVVRQLLEAGVEVDYMDTNGETPLLRASYRGHEGIVKLLLEAGADANRINKHGETALSWASYRGHEATVALVLKAGAKVDTKNMFHQTPLSSASAEGHEAVVELLLGSGAQVDTGNEESRTPLSQASEFGYEAVVKLLLKAGGQVDARDEDDKTPLLHASKNGHEAVAKLLLNADAEVDTRDKDNKTPLLWACEYGHEAVVRLLVKAGAEANIQDNKNNHTPLYHAVLLEHEALVALLLEAGAEVSSGDNFGRTLLHWAVILGHEAIVKRLLEAGAVVNARDGFHQTPLDCAINQGHEAIMKQLLEAGAEFRDGMTPFT